MFCIDIHLEREIERLLGKDSLEHLQSIIALQRTKEALRSHGVLAKDLFFLIEKLIEYSFEKIGGFEKIKSLCTERLERRSEADDFAAEATVTVVGLIAHTPEIREEAVVILVSMLEYSHNRVSSKAFWALKLLGEPAEQLFQRALLKKKGLSLRN
ncbi:MAG: hypothetical protein ACE5J0_02455 [Candidatus Paceibacterales bacterium]